MTTPRKSRPVYLTREDVEAIIGRLRQPVEMTGPRWMAYAVEASERLDEVQRRNAAQFVQAVGRG